MKRPIPGNIVLIGFLCSGKSTVGQLLAQSLSLNFFDSDQVIEQEIGAIPAFVERYGASAFRHKEYQLIIQTMPEQGTVIATGAGTLLPHPTRKLFSPYFARTYFLEAPFQVLYERLLALPSHHCHRPDFLAHPQEQSKLRMLKEYRQRQPLYKRMGIPVDATGSPQQMVEDIAKLNSGDPLAREPGRVSSVICEPRFQISA